MRLAGRIIDWDDDRGFGFVAPNGGGDRAFVHINEFQHGSRRPIDGDLVSYRVARDPKGRLQAREIRHAGQGIRPRRPSSRFPGAAIGAASLLGLICATALGLVPLALTSAYFVLSVVSYAMYASDKAAAGRNARRIPESSLHLAGLFGGWPGALIAQQQFRHKTIKQPFQVVFWITVILNVAGGWWLLSSGFLPGLTRSISGHQGIRVDLASQRDLVQASALKNQNFHLDLSEGL